MTIVLFTLPSLTPFSSLCRLSASREEEGPDGDIADILRALDTGDLAVLTLLDLSAAFDTVDHATLLRRLEVSYGLRGHVLGWFQSYLDGRTEER